MSFPAVWPGLQYLQIQGKLEASLGEAIGLEVSVLTLTIAALYGAFAVISLLDLKRLIVLVLRSSEQAGTAGEILRGTSYGSDAKSSDSDKSSDSGKPAPQVYGRTPAPISHQETWSALSIACLMGYRFYSGFNSATWLPFLLAKEGEDLWADDQAAFMGCAKLIYGATMTLNPAMGLFGDRAVTLSHGLGRRVFVRFGIVFASLGIFICMVSDSYHNFWTFMIGILVWRLGETMNDVTVEAIAPEMVPASQYPQASAIKACLFLVGGVTGYVMLICFSHVHYSWVYLAYLIGMLTCSYPVLYLLSNDAPLRPERRRDIMGMSASEYLTRAYITPMHIPGGFPLACLSVFTFSLGTAPMFFILLMVRDLLGIRIEAQQQRQFSYLSLEFFMAAAVASVLAARSGRSSLDEDRLTEEQKEQAEEINWAHRSKMLLLAITIFGVSTAALAFTSVLPTQEQEVYIYAVASVFGFSFGSAYARFQDITWQLLPPNVDMASSMGFNVMSRNAGLGLGNFLAGLMLDCFATISPPLGDAALMDPELEQSYVHYSAAGYYVMCGVSALAVFVSVYVAKQAVSFSLKDLKPLIPTAASA